MRNKSITISASAINKKIKNMNRPVMAAKIYKIHESIHEWWRRRHYGGTTEELRRLSFMVDSAACAVVRVGCNAESVATDFTIHKRCAMIPLGRLRPFHTDCGRNPLGGGWAWLAG